MKFPSPTLTSKTEEAIVRVDKAADDAWKEACMAAITEACRQWEKFTSEDVSDLLDDLDVTTHEPRAMGAMMRKAQFAGLCKPTMEFVPSHREKSNRYTKRVWQRCFIPNQPREFK